MSTSTGDAVIARVHLLGAMYSVTHRTLPCACVEEFAYTDKQIAVRVPVRYTSFNAQCPLAGQDHRSGWFVVGHSANRWSARRVLNDNVGSLAVVLTPTDIFVGWSYVKNTSSRDPVLYRVFTDMLPGASRFGGYADNIEAPTKRLLRDALDARIDAALVACL